jgi:4-amino-4-deoxy-L-arabinose transferase-like glycosyltransferase
MQRVPRRTERLLIVLILLAAAGLRLYRLDNVPPGWRDDEVVETTVHAALIQQGHWLLFFPQAEGHEPLYHYLSAALISAAGSSLFVVRLLSVFFGLLSVAALYRLARRLFGAPPALLASAGLAVSFWSLMYSRFKLRQVGILAPMLLALDFVFLACDARRPAARRRWDGLWAAFCLSAALYTYYAARAVPLILLAFAAYLAVFQRARFRAAWRPLALAGALTLALVAPLAVAIAVTPQSQQRLSEVGAPLANLLHGDPGYVLRNTAETLAMPAFTGDPEFLYNIPGRPLFEPLGALLLALGVLLAAWHWREPRYAFLLIWLLGGLAPAFVSTPSASLGHTIAAQPVIYLLPALAVVALGRALRPRLGGVGRWFALLLAAAFLLVLAARDLTDYFVSWPALEPVRLLYRADLHEAAAALRRLPAGSTLGLSSESLHPVDALALALDTPGLNLHTPVFVPARAWVFPNQSTPLLLLGSALPVGLGQPPPAGDYELRPASLGTLAQPALPAQGDFQNGWTCYGYRLTLVPTLTLLTYWRVTAGYHPPAPRPVDQLSGTPLPLKLFSHLLGPAGNLVAGDDQLDVDPATLRAGDSFVQSFSIALPASLPVGTYRLRVGIYDPASGLRVMLMNGADGVDLATPTLP